MANYDHISWTPTQWDAAGEVHTFRTVVGGVNYGDHSPGRINDKVTVQNIEVWGHDGNSGWESPPEYTSPPDEANMRTSLGGVSGTGYQIWDKRCY